MESFQSTEDIGKNQALIQATEKMETLITLDPQFQAYQQPLESPEIPPISSASFMALWSVFLVVQALMFWRQKKQKAAPQSPSKKESQISEQIDKSDRYRGEAKVTETEPQRPYWVGRVAFQGIYWKARSLSPVNLEAGDICEVIGVSTTDITLIVREIPHIVNC